MKDASFDSAVMTFTLCSLADIEKSLSEIYRVLKVGGRLLFLEHGLSDVRSESLWQRRCTPLRRRLCEGCRLDRPIDTLISQAGFSIEEMTNYRLKKVPRVFWYMYEGVAVK